MSKPIDLSCIKLESYLDATEGDYYLLRYDCYEGALIIENPNQSSQEIWMDADRIDKIIYDLQQMSEAMKRIGVKVKPIKNEEV